MAFNTTEILRCNCGKQSQPFSSKTDLTRLRHFPSRPWKLTSSESSETRKSTSPSMRLLNNVPSKFNSFTVQDRPVVLWMTVRGKFGDTEDMKIEVTMFYGYETVPKTGDDSTGEDVCLHLSMLVDISRGDGSNDLEFLCLAWPDRLEVQKVYVLHHDRMPAKPYMGPDFESLKRTIQKRFSRVGLAISDCLAETGYLLGLNDAA